MTSVTLLEGYASDAALGTDISCVAVRTIDRDEQNHAVTETIYYKGNTGGTTWRSFGQSFQFEADSRGYNIMKSQGLSGAPSGTYNFSYSTRDCAVVMVTNFGNRMPDDTPSEVQERDVQNVDQDQNAGENDGASENEDGKPQCMLWGTRENPRGIQDCCEKHFTKYCQKNKDYEYTPEKCPSPPPEERTEL
ncbi:hypothetical protein HPB50_024708 [Hyalomma asiaticum]|uniref:Uncharacterized protein n=1 Tax=Hyalomma asiaticum TaxID=266040 RepID=A0ACB7RP79_HYAAI|nr:hypothetical protein HPB50_024708 [Hyalomma asiaticum]